MALYGVIEQAHMTGQRTTKIGKIKDMGDVWGEINIMGYLMSMNKLSADSLQRQLEDIE